MKKGFYKNLPVRVKLIISHGIISVVAILAAIAGIISISAVVENLEETNRGPLAATSSIGDILYTSSDLQRVSVAMLTAMGSGAEYVNPLIETMEANVSTMASATEALYVSLSGNPEAQALVEEIGTLISNSTQPRQDLLALVNSGKADINTANMSYQANYRPFLQQIQEKATVLRGTVNAIAEQQYRDSQNNSRMLTLMMIVLCAVIIAITAIMTGVITNSIRRPVKQIMDAAKQMQAGNLAVADDITYDAKDELGVLADAMRDTMHFLHACVTEISNDLTAIARSDLSKDASEITQFRGDFTAISQSMINILDSLNSTMNNIQIASQEVNGGAAQIADGAQALAQGATEQAASVEELSSSITDISAQVNRTAEHAASARETMEATSSKAQTCNDQMHHMTEAMQAISDQADEISKIIKTIEDIAFQTNILALNAAVEAARAGAAGKGFAVVADEVRNLAAKSAEASRNTSNLITGTVAAVNNGNKVLAETAGTLEELVNDAQSAARLVDEISNAAIDEANALSQITTGIDQIAAVVQTTSSTSEESAASSHELSSQSAMLKSLVEQFRLRVN